jgi:DNA-binding response OmpR family regulator
MKLAEEFGANAYITKPYQDAELLATVDEHLARVPVRQPAS